MMDKKDSERLNRVETRLTKLMVFMGCDPYNADRINLDPKRKTISIRDKSVTLFELQEIVAEQGEQGVEYTVMLGNTELGGWVKP